MTLPGLPARLHRSWRQLAAGVCFVAFAVGAMVVGSVIIPVARLLAPGVERRRDVSRAVIRG
ncbi:MAG TPA: hypothetical protein VLW55_06720, partial [Burkholderiaceae bacterium]|nr:hypothetical protein [Burkholderiaceae bacterium]